MSDVTDTFRNTLKSHGQSLTSSRQAVFDVLRGSEPLTMHQIIGACSLSTDRASVYRTIKLFEKLGIVQRLNIGWKYKLELTDAYSHHHHHLTCTACGNVTPLVEDDDLERHLTRLAGSHRFDAESHQLEIRGRCQSCQKS